MPRLKLSDLRRSSWVIGVPNIWQFHRCRIKIIHILVISPNVETQTLNKAQSLAACGHVSASNQSLCLILNLKLYLSFITSRPG